jgi:hypothetical protein
MSTWTSDELAKIGAADELKLTTVRDDGTPRKPVTMWVVRLGDDLYVRSVRGRSSGWFRGTQAHHEGQIQSGGVEKAVTFVEETSPDINAQFDMALRSKYRRYDARYVDPMLKPEARAATVKLVPQATTS